MTEASDIPEESDMRATASGANSHVSAPIINLNLGDGVGQKVVKWLFAGIGGLALLITVTVVVAYKGQQQAEFTNQTEQAFEGRVNQRFTEMDKEDRLWQYWGERCEVEAGKQGIKLPPLPHH